MSDILNDKQKPAFYRHSGKTDLHAVPLGIVAAVIIGAVVGSIMGPLELFGHMLGYLKLMIMAEGLTVIGGGTLIGYALGRLLVRVKCRSGLLVDACVFVAGIVALYFAWAGWLYAFVLWTRGSSTYFFLATPRHLFHAMAVLNRTGTWYISQDDAPTGIALTVIWILEAGTVLVSALLVARKDLGKKVFCEACGTWGQKRHLMQVRDARFQEMKAGLLAGRAEVFEGAGRPPAGALSWCDVMLEGCPTCDNLQALSLERTVMTVTRKGKYTTKKTKIVKRILLTPDQTAQVAMAAAALTHGTPAAVPTARLEGDPNPTDPSA